MKVQDLIPLIRHIINEAAVPEDPFTAETDEAIKDFIRSAMVQLAAMPSYQGTPATLKGVDRVTYSKRPDGLYYAEISIPDNCLRAVSVNMKGWVRPVYEFFPASGTLFLQQYSSVLGIGAGASSPVAFITTGGERLVIAHATKESGNCEFLYIAVPEIGSDGSISIPDVYREALAYTAAALYMQSINEYDAAKAAFDSAGSFIQSINSKVVQ